MTYDTALFQRVAREWFGVPPSIIVSYLVRSGSCTLHQLVIGTQLHWTQLRNSLVLLLKKDIVRCELHGSAIGGAETRYTFHRDGLLALLRGGRYLHYIERLYGIGGKYLAFQFLKHGFCRMKDAIDGAVQDYATLREIIELPNAKKRVPEMSRHHLVQSFKNMIAEAIFSRPLTLDKMLEEAVGRSADAKKSSQADFGLLGSNSKAAEGPSDTDVFRLNYENLNVRLVVKAVEEFITFRWANVTVSKFIAKALLVNARRHGQRILTDAMVLEELAVTFDREIKRENQWLSQNEASPTIYAEHETEKIFTAVDIMSRHSDKLIKAIRRATGTLFQVDWNRCRDFLLRRLTSSVITNRYGLEAARAYALVVDSDGKGQEQIKSNTETDVGANETASSLRYPRFWNDQEVSDLGLMSPQIARKCLCQLTEGGFIKSHMADVVGAVPSSASSQLAKHCWVFGASEEDTYNNLIDYFYRILGNILERRAVEVEKIQNLALQGHDLTEKSTYEMTSRELAEDTLDSALLAVDRCLMTILYM